MYPAAEKRFILANRVTIIVLFLVIAAGGIVRSTGSGMGCPDWPKCFNQVIPPTHVSQLPEGYEKEYIEGRAKKNIRFARTVELLGFHEKADEIRHDKSILAHEEFNVAKTWTEYINRLVGVIAGFFIILTTFFSFTYIKKRPSIFIWSLVNLIVIIIQGWLGSIVVSTNLMPWIITVHMLIALVIVAISIYTFFKATTLRNTSILVNHHFKGIKLFILGTLALLLLQIVIGTEVREIIDDLNYKEIERSAWIDSIGKEYFTHRLLGYITFFVVLVLFFIVKSRFSVLSIQSKLVVVLLILAVLQMLTGIILGKFAVPPFAQSAHLILASLFFGATYYLMLLMTKLKH